MIRRPHPRRTVASIGSFGIDAPWILGATLALGLACAIAAALAFRADSTWAGAALGALASPLLLSAASHLHTTLRGKLVIWGGVLDELDLSGDELVLDIGCGRGAVLLQVAERLTTGRVVGVDLWRSSDQSGNSEAATRRNAAAAGVIDRVDVLTADMTDLPFPDDSFDVVLSSMAIHNVGTADGRAAAIGEAIRVLRPRGRLAIADIRGTGEYRDRLRRAGIAGLEDRDLGWRAWWSGPLVSTTLLTGTKPMGAAGAPEP